MPFKPRCFLTGAASTGATISPALTGWTNAGAGVAGTAPAVGDVVFLFSGVGTSGKTVSQTAGTPTWILEGPDTQVTVSLDTFVGARIWDGTETAPTWTWSSGGRQSWLAVAFTYSPVAAPFGASINLNASTPGYPGTDGESVNWANAQQFDTYVLGSSSFRMAQQIQKLFLTIGQLPSNITTVWPDVATYIANGGKVLISFRPHWTTNGSSLQDTAFAATLDSCMSVLGTNWKGTLWAECNQPPFGHSGANWEFGSVDGYTGVNGSAADYQAYVAHYGPIFRSHCSGIPLVFDPEVASGSNNGGSGNAAGAVAYCPASTWVDEVAVDYYCTTHNAGQRIDTVVAMADTLGVPFGIAEFGMAASSVFPGWTEWGTYIDYLIGIFAARQAAGKPNGWIIYFGSNGSGGLGGSDSSNSDSSGNGVGSASDLKIPGIVDFRNTVGV